VTVTAADCELDDDHHHYLLHPHDDWYFLLLADVHLHFHPGSYSGLLELSLTIKRTQIKSISRVVHF
jgi:hypothetical protein